MSVTEYFSELNNMWEQMDFFDPLTMKCTVDALSFENWLNKRRTFRFLTSLNPEFEPIRQSLWQRIPLPTLRDAFGVVVQEESRRKAMISLPVQEGSTMLSQPHANLQINKICDYCHKINHTRENCWDLHGKPTRGRGCGRGQGRGRGSGRSGGPQQAHVADSTSKPTSFFDKVMAQLMTQLAARFTSTTSMSSTPPPIAPSGADGYNLLSLLATAVKPVSTIVKALTAKLNPDKSWIVDFGASKHMTSDSTLFKTYKLMSGRDKVQTTDG
jgi:hypothetical protein